MPTTNVYRAGKKTRIKVNETFRGFNDGTYTTTTATDDMSHTEDGAFGRDIGTQKRCTINGTLVFKATEPLDFDEDDEVDIDLTNPGAPGLEGVFLVTSMGYPHMNPKVGIKISVTMVSQGAYVKKITPEETP